MTLAVFAFAACSKDAEETAGSLSVSSGGSAVTSIAVNADGATQTIDVKADGEWSIVLIGSDTDWILVGLPSGKNNASVPLIFEKNTSVINRVAQISFVSGDRELAYISVAQTGYGPNLAVTPDKAALTEDGGKATFQIASNNDAWEYTLVGDNWLVQSELSPSTLQFYAPKNLGKEKAATVTFKLTNYPQITKTVTITQEAQTVVPTFITLNAPSTAEIDLGDAEDLNFAWTGTNITGAYVFEISAAADMSSPVQSIETSDETLSFPTIDFDLSLLNAGVASGSGATLYWSVKPKDATANELTQELEVRQLRLKRPAVKSDDTPADLFDAVFSPDLSATDVSGNNYNIVHVDYDHTATVRYNKTYQRYMAVFDPKKGNGTSTGTADGDYYKFDYGISTSIQTFMDKLADGHTFECLAKFDFDYTASSPTYETKFFSTMGSGGTGFLVTNSSQATGANALAFIPHTGGYRWANTKIKPDGKTYYHLVGVYDKTAAKAYIYLDGALLGEADAAGNYVHPSAFARWICIGGDPGSNIAEGTFKGNIVIARIYDKALTATEVTALWNKVKP